MSRRLPTTKPSPGRRSPHGSRNNLGITEDDGRLVRAMHRSRSQGPTASPESWRHSPTPTRRLVSGPSSAGSSRANGSQGPTDASVSLLSDFISSSARVTPSMRPPSVPKTGSSASTLRSRLKDEDETAIYPLVFCRACGQDYYSVVRNTRPNGDTSYEPAALADQNP